MNPIMKINNPIMKKSIFLVALSLSCCSGILYAQKIDMPIDSVRILLCRKWTPSFEYVGNTRKDIEPGEVYMDLEFKQDGVFLYSGSHPNQVGGKGTWSYDPQKKSIQLVFDDNTRSSISSLTQNVMMMGVDMKEASPGQPGWIKIVYKIKGN